MFFDGIKVKERPTKRCEECDCKWFEKVLKGEGVK